jgi:hypothetical protein
MKKLIFFLVMAVVFEGMIFAVETTHPPWTPETVMSEFGVEFRAATPDAVSVAVLPELVAGVYLAMPDTNTKMYNTGQPQFYMIKPIGTGNGAFTDRGYWLRL